MEILGLIVMFALLLVAPAAMQPRRRDPAIEPRPRCHCARRLTDEEFRIFTGRMPSRSYH